MGFWKIRVEWIVVGGLWSGSLFKFIVVLVFFKVDMSKKNSFFIFYVFNCDIMFRVRLVIVCYELKSLSFS